MYKRNPKKEEGEWNQKEKEHWRGKETHPEKR